MNNYQRRASCKKMILLKGATDKPLVASLACHEWLVSGTHISEMFFLQEAIIISLFLILDSGFPLTLALSLRERARVRVSK
jgi:hypothetical protein